MINVSRFVAGIGVLLCVMCTAVFADDIPDHSQPCYYVAEFTVHDPEGIKPYSAQVESTFAPYGGKFIVRGGEIESLEGVAPTQRRVVIAFPSIERAKAWYASPAYVELRKIRQKTADASVYLVPGIATSK